MCEFLARGANQIELVLAAGFVLGFLFELFPVLNAWEFIKKALLTAGISIVLALLSFGIGAAQSCWLFTLDAAWPFLVAGGAAAVAALAGEGAVKGTRAVNIYRANR